MSNNPPRIVERFTRTGADEIVYEFTVEDLTSWMRPWSAHIPMASTDEMLFEYACHEGNHDKQAADKAR